MKKSFNVLGGNITRCRDRLGLDVATLAASARVTSATIRYIEEGKADIDIEVISNIADSLGVSVSDLTTGIPKFVIQEELFRAHIRSVDKNTKYIITSGERVYTGYVSKEHGREEITVYNTQGRELPNGALANILKNILFDHIKKISSKPGREGGNVR